MKYGPIRFLATLLVSTACLGPLTLSGCGNGDSPALVPADVGAPPDVSVSVDEGPHDVAAPDVPPKPDSCGDMVCDKEETAFNCAADCRVGKTATCTRESCEAPLKACNADGACESTLFCVLGCKVEGCVPACFADAGVDMTSGPAEALSTCIEEASCVQLYETCGNGTCDKGEDEDSCPKDCGTAPPVTCPDGICQAGEPATCPEDCVEPPPPATCQGQCGEPFSDGGCGCDSGCWDFDDCCDDWLDLCGPKCGDGECDTPESIATCPQDCAGLGDSFGCVVASCDTGGCELVPGCLDAVSCLLACFDPSNSKACTTSCVEDQPLPAQSLLWEIATCASESDCIQAPVCGNGECQPGETLENCAADCAIPAEESCLDKCGNFKPDAPCQCDNECLQFGDCCEDYEALCGEGPPDPTIECLQDECPDEGGGCFALPKCLEAASCVAACGTDEDCAKGCTTDTPAPAVAALNKLVACGTKAGCFEPAD